MEKVLALIQAKNEDLEARSRRNNLRITGLPESTNMGQCKTYIENLIKEIIGHENLSSLFIIEWAHRSLVAKPIPGATPRPIIARVLNYRDRDNILRMAREKGTINFQGNSISFFPDFTVAVQAARREYGAVKKFLQSEGIAYAMLYPARLRIGQENESTIFSNPKAAMDYAKKMKRQQRESHAELEEDAS